MLRKLNDSYGLKEARQIKINLRFVVLMLQIKYLLCILADFVSASIP
jgi:hypothetical protein